jgi:hypothetical protein
MGWRDWFGAPAGPPAWPRPLWSPGGGQARFDIIVVGAGRAAAAPADLRVEGAARAALPAGVGWRRWDRSADPAGFAGALGRLRGALEAPPAGLGAAAEHAEHLHEINGAVEDAADFAALGAAWALARALLRGGAAGLVDLQAGTWCTAHMALSPDPDPSRLARSFRVWCKPVAAPVAGAVCWTAGLAKAARPDLVCLLPEAHLELGQRALLDLGEALCRGQRAAPGDRVGLGPVHARLDALQPGDNAPDLGLNNVNGGLLVVLFAGPLPGT